MEYKKALVLNLDVLQLGSINRAFIADLVNMLSYQIWLIADICYYVYQIWLIADICYYVYQFRFSSKYTPKYFTWWDEYN